MNGQTITFEDLVTKFQLTSESLESLERSCRELQDRVRTLTEELEREREARILLERFAAMLEMDMELAHEIRNPLGSIELYASMIEGEYAERIVTERETAGPMETGRMPSGFWVFPWAHCATAS